MKNLISNHIPASVSQVTLIFLVFSVHTHSTVILIDCTVTLSASFTNHLNLYHPASNLDNFSLFVFSYVGAPLQHVGSFNVAHALLSSCGMETQDSTGLVVVCGLSCPATCGTSVPRPGIEPMSFALEGGFLTSGLLGTSHRASD